MNVPGPRVAADASTVAGHWFGDLRLGAKSALLLGMVMSFFVLSAVMFLVGQAQVADARRWTEHSYTVLAEAAQLEILMVEQTATLRGYQLTGHPEYRETFDAAALGFGQHLQTLRQLTADNAEQQARLQRLAEQYRQWQLNFTEPALRLAADPNRHGEQLDFARAQRGKPYRIAIRTEIDAIVTVENVLLATRNAALTATLARSRWMSILTLGLGLLASGLALFGVRRYVSLPLGRLRHVVDLQASGDLDATVPDRQRRDEIGSIARAIEAFRRVSVAARQREWLKTEVSRLGSALSRCESDQEFGTAILDQLCPLVGAGYGVLYRVHDESLRAIAGYGFDLAQADAHLGRHGVAMQCARSGVAIELNPVPADYLHIASGLGTALPRCVQLLPLSGAHGTIGVLELASFEPLSATSRELLVDALQLAGLAMEALGNALRTKELLEETRVQAEELQSSEESLRVQAEELRTTNEALADKGRALNEFNARLVEFQAELERKNLDLENASRYKSEFLANMSHELRTPLNSLLILAKDLADNGSGNLTAEQVESAQIVHDSGSNLLNLINDILDLSKIEAGRMDVHWEAVEPRALAKTVDLQFRRSAQQRGLGLSVDVDADVPASIVSDAGKLTQILVNLVGNALKFTPHGEVRVHIGRPDTETPALAGSTAQTTLALSVSDTGIGMTAEQMARLFQPFEQGDGTTSRRYGGTGLGLSISRALARMIGGEIVVRSTPGSGSRFTLLVPEQSALAAGANSEPAPVISVPAPARSLPAMPAAPNVVLNDDRALIASGEVVILIAEDDGAFARVLADIARRKGYRALIASDGASALELARRYRPHGILLDIGLPLLDGFQVLEQLKVDPALRHIPVHVVSANDEASRGLALGAVGVVSKPATREALDAAFGRVMHFADGRRRKLLLIDDEAAARTAITRLLADQAVDIVEAETVAGALDTLAHDSFDCIILDLTLPDASGFELLERLAQRGAVPPVVIYSARELSRDENAKLREYTDSIVIKGAQSPGRLLDEVTLFLHAMRRPAPAAAEHPAGDLAGRTVLIVDDDMRNVFALSKALRSHGLTVVVAQDGHKALAQLEQHPGIECVLMDVMMPGMDGYEATREIRRRPQWRELPVIAVTAKAMQGDREKCLEAGANDYLTKPIDLDRLLSVMRAWLHRE